MPVLRTVDLLNAARDLTARHQHPASISTQFKYLRTQNWHSWLDVLTSAQRGMSWVTWARFQRRSHDLCPGTPCLNILPSNLNITWDALWLKAEHQHPAWTSPKFKYRVLKLWNQIKKQSAHMSATMQTRLKIHHETITTVDEAASVNQSLNYMWCWIWRSVLFHHTTRN